MSKRINVNPAHYKVAGRERQGDAVIQSLERQQFAQQRAAEARWQGGSAAAADKIALGSSQRLKGSKAQSLGGVAEEQAKRPRGENAGRTQRLKGEKAKSRKDLGSRSRKTAKAPKAAVRARGTKTGRATAANRIVTRRSTSKRRQARSSNRRSRSK